MLGGLIGGIGKGLMGGLGKGLLGGLGKGGGGILGKLFGGGAGGGGILSKLLEGAGGVQGIMDQVMGLIQGGQGGGGEAAPAAAAGGDQAQAQPKGGQDNQFVKMAKKFADAKSPEDVDKLVKKFKDKLGGKSPDLDKLIGMMAQAKKSTFAKAA